MIKAIEPLGKHDRAAFSCGVAALDDWFGLRAGQDKKRNVARVFVTIRSRAVFAIVVEATADRDFGFVPFPNRPLRLFMPASEAAEAVSRALSR